MSCKAVFDVMWIDIEPKKVYIKQLFNDKCKQLVAARTSFVQQVRERRRLLPDMILELNEEFPAETLNSDWILKIKTGELEDSLSSVLWVFFSSLSAIRQ